MSDKAPDMSIVEMYDVTKTNDVELPHMTIVEEYDDSAGRLTWLLSFNSVGASIVPHTRIVKLGPGRYGRIEVNNRNDMGTCATYGDDDCFDHQVEAITFSLAMKIFPRHPDDEN